MWNNQSILFMILLAISCSSAATILYLGPITMTSVFSWDSNTQSLVFLSAAVCNFIGTLCGKNDRLISLKKTEERFDAAVFIISLQVAMVIGIILIYIGTKFEIKWSCYLLGILIVFVTYSIISTIITSLFSFILPSDAKQGMMPLVSCVIAVGKVAAPIITAGEYLLLGWDLVFTVWIIFVVLILIMSIYKKELLRTQDTPLPEYNSIGNKLFKYGMSSIVITSLIVATLY